MKPNEMTDGTLLPRIQQRTVSQSSTYLAYATARKPSFFRTPPFRLLDLPAEIREAIFKFALSSEKPLVSFRLDGYQQESYQEASQPPLTRVSRQVREETLPTFYAINEFIFHTDKVHDTRKWLACYENVLPKIRKLLFWVRYVTLTNDRSPSNGAICLTVRNSMREGCWRVVDRWRWVTVTRKPSAVEGDAKFLMDEMSRTLLETPDCLITADGVIGLMTDLKMLYIKEKMT